MEQSHIFAETCQWYLGELAKIDLACRADLIGVMFENGALRVPFYDREYLVSGEGITENSGREISPAVRVVLCKYIMTCPAELPVLSDSLITYREFKDAGPLISYFTTNTNKIIETTFAGRLNALRERSVTLGGEIQTSQTYDFSVQFHALPRIPVVLNFNDRDDLFPANASILYRASAECFLDMECLAITGTLLAGLLIRP